MQLLNGKKIAQDIREQLKKDIAQSGITPGLAAILVGDDPASHLYVGLKEKAAQEAGIHFERIEFPADTTQQTIIEKIHELNAQAHIHGILTQLPLPKHLNTNAIIAEIDAAKNVDALLCGDLSDEALATLPVASPPHSATIRFLQETGIDLEGKKVAIVANSQEFALPLERILTQKGCEVASLVRKDSFSAYTKKADIVIIAVGKPNLITVDDIKKNAILIDVGTNKLPDGHVVGDIDFESVKEKASFITPVPGGVGPMTVALLLRNTFELAKQ